MSLSGSTGSISQPVGRARRRSASKAPAPRLYVLDGLRLAAALAVVMYHYVALRGGWDKNPQAIFPGLHKVAQYGWLGVEFFFLISGFVICMSTWGRTLGDFVVSRASRLYPAYWFGVAATTTVLTVWPQVHRAEDTETVFANLSMLQTGLNSADVDDAYWTLFAELRFYVLFAIVVALGVTYRRCVMFCGIWIVAAMINPMTDTKFVSAWAMSSYAPYFVAGIAFFLMHKYRPNAVLWSIVGISFAVAQRFVTARIAINLGARGADVPEWPVRVGILLAFVLMAGVALGWFDRIQWKWLTTAGALTYPLYVIHMWIGMTIIYHLRGRMSPYALLAGVMAFMLVAAWIIARFVEKPLSLWMRRALKKGMEDIRLNTARDERASARHQPPTVKDSTTAVPEPAVAAMYDRQFAENPVLGTGPVRPGAQPLELVTDQSGYKPFKPFDPGVSDMDVDPRKL